MSGGEQVQCIHEVTGSPVALQAGLPPCPVALPCPRCGRPATKWCFPGYFLDRGMKALLAEMVNRDAAAGDGGAARRRVLEFACEGHRAAAERLLAGTGTRRARRTP